MLEAQQLTPFLVFTSGVPNEDVLKLLKKATEHISNGPVLVEIVWKEFRVQNEWKTFLASTQHVR